MPALKRAEASRRASLRGPCPGAAVCAAPAGAQEPAHQHDAPTTPWQWSLEGSAFAGYNYQWRKFTDFDEIESQNWLMTGLQKIVRHV